MPPKKKPPKPKPSRQQPARPPTSSADSSNPSPLPPPPSFSLPQQQRLLDIFARAHLARLPTDPRPLLQQVKTHLYNRDFRQAFGAPQNLDAYAARWSPGRALAYVGALTAAECAAGRPLGGRREGGVKKCRVVCLGGGAGAEVVALAGLWATRAGAEDGGGGGGRGGDDGGGDASGGSLEVRVVDVAAWGAVLESLREGIVTAPELSKYASAAAKAANEPLLRPDLFALEFRQLDLLKVDAEVVAELVSEASIFTLMFTLNELYTTSLAETQGFLFKLSDSVQRGTLLLVVDSPGSYSTVNLNGSEKKYPMHWLLDHQLLSSVDDDSREGQQLWNKIYSEDSVWFRTPEILRYPIELENMRYQIHVYRKN